VAFTFAKKRTAPKTATPRAGRQKAPMTWKIPMKGPPMSPTSKSTKKAMPP
jgi:hypothetical protein